MAQTYDERVILPLTSIKSFINDFSKFYFHLKQIKIDKSCEIIKVCEDVFEEYTKPFFAKWSTFKFLRWNNGYIQHFFSFVLLCKGVKILIPHRLISFELINPQNNLLDQFAKAKTANEFFEILSKILLHQNLPLLKNDIRIIKDFHNPILQTKIASIPTNRELGNIMRISENTISRRLSHLYQTTILSHLYRIDMAKLGYHTISITHLESDSSIPSEIDHYCLLDMPIDLGDELGRIKVLQIPVSQISNWNVITDYLHPLNYITLTKSYIGYNLAGLTCNPEERWKLFPPIMKGGFWDEIYVSESAGINLNLFKNTSGLKVSNTELKMLNLIQNGTMTNVHLSETLGVTPKYIKQFFDHFFSEKLIHRFSPLSHIGLDLKIGLTLIAPFTDDKLPILERIVNHLKFFPFCFLMYNDLDLDLYNKMLLLGLIRIPSHWITQFSNQWMKLSKYGFIPKFVIESTNAKWGIDLENTYPMKTDL